MEQFNINTICGKVRVYKKGIGEKKLLLLHGAGCDSAMLSWRETMERLYYDDYTVYAPDLPGYGDSERAENLAGSEFYQKYALALCELCNAFDLQDFTLVGLSMGAAIAVRFALDEPDWVRQLVLVDPWGVTRRMPFHRFMYRYLKKETHMRFWYGLMAKSRFLTKWMVGHSLIGDKAKITPELVSEVWEACRREDAYKSMHDYQISSITKKECVPNYEKDWAHLPMPVIFIQGENDPLVQAEDVQRAAKLVPVGKYYELEGCKHWSVREKPEEFIRILEEEQENCRKTATSV